MVRLLLSSYSSSSSPSSASLSLCCSIITPGLSEQQTHHHPRCDLLHCVPHCALGNKYRALIALRRSVSHTEAVLWILNNPRRFHENTWLIYLLTNLTLTHLCMTGTWHTGRHDKFTLSQSGVFCFDRRRLFIFYASNERQKCNNHSWLQTT